MLKFEIIVWPRATPKVPMFRGGTFCKMLGLYLMFHARFIHATLIGVMLNFWKVGVAPTTPFYTKNPPLPVKFMISNSILTMQSHRPNVKI